MGNGYFNITQDIVIEQAGGFFCQSCIASYSLENRSPNYKFCQQCYDILKGERELQNPIPIKSVEELPPKGVETPPVKEKACNKQILVANHRLGNVTVENVTVKKDGKKQIFDKVKRLTLQDKSSRTVKAELEKGGIIISHMTVSRMQRKIRQGVLF